MHAIPEQGKSEVENLILKVSRKDLKSVNTIEVGMPRKIRKIKLENKQEK